MADRTWVTVTVRSVESEEIQEILREFEKESFPDYVTELKDFRELYYCEVSYGEIPELEILEDAVVSYDVETGTTEHIEGSEKSFRCFVDPVTGEKHKKVWEKRAYDSLDPDDIRKRVRLIMEQSTKQGMRKAAEDLEKMLEEWIDSRICPFPL